MRVSPSRLKVFGDCANQYYYQHILKLEGGEYSALTTLGSVWHYAVEVYEQYENDIELAVATFRHYWNNVEDLGLRIDHYPRRTNHESLADHGVKMLERYHELSPWKGGILVSTEIKFEVPLGEHTLTGIIDKLFYRPQKNELQVIDFKTGVKVPEKLRFNLQFTAYLYATSRPEFWEQILGWEDFEFPPGLKRIGQWYHARNNKMFNAGYRDDSDFRRLLHAVNQMESAIESGIFPLTIEGAACGWCPWVDVCGTEVVSPNADLEK